jgi:phosphoglucosamine mutase
VPVDEPSFGVPVHCIERLSTARPDPNRRWGDAATPAERAAVLATEMGCAVETLNAQPDGSFPGRPSEPTAENCESLTALVANSDADLGIAHDGDADRARAVTADGEFVPGDVLLALFAREAAEPGQRVAAPVNTSLAVDDHLADIDVTVTRTKVGDVHVAEQAAEDGVAFGGEPSGAWIWPAAGTTRPRGRRGRRPASSRRRTRRGRGR